MKYIKYFAVLASLALIWVYFTQSKHEIKMGRLLISIEKGAGFTAEEFAKAAGAKFVKIDRRNPFISLNDIYFDYPFIVVSEKPYEPLSLYRVSSKFGYRYVPLSNASIDEAVKEAKSYLDKVPIKSSEIPYLSKDEGHNMYDLMQKLDEALTENGITYWATAGTLLGAVRHHGLIPWDDDLDICIFDTDEKKLKSMQEIFSKYDLEIHYYFKDFYKVFPKNGKQIPDVKNPGQFLPFKYPFADVFVVSLQRNHEMEDVYAHKSQEFYYYFNKEIYAYSQLQNLSRVSFGPITIVIPGDPEKFLNNCYGTKEFPELWKYYALEPTWIHKTETSSQVGGASLVEIDDFAPGSY
jgi:lipopolysaccharide cholinephosphotransferase